MSESTTLIGHPPSPSQVVAVVHSAIVFGLHHLQSFGASASAPTIWIQRNQGLDQDNTNEHLWGAQGRT